LEGQRFGCVVDRFSESYTFQRVEGIPYDYACRVFASRERIYPLFAALGALVNQPCTAFLADYSTPDLDLYASDVIAKEEALDSFTRHSFQLVNDGFTHFWIESEDLEIGVERDKNLEIFGKSLTQVLEVLKGYGIPKEPKRSLFGDAPHNYVKISELFEDRKTMKMCEPLPGEEVEKYESDPKAYKGFFQEIVEGLRMKLEEDE
jgi:hypothetical protein